MAAWYGKRTSVCLLIIWFVDKPLFTLAEGSAPQFAVKHPEFSVCAPEFAGRVGATDPDGDKIVYTLVGSSPASLDYVVDTGTGHIKSFRPFHPHEKSVLTLQASDTTGLSTITTVTINYQECGSRLVEPDQPLAGTARFLEPLSPRNVSSGLFSNISHYFNISTIHHEP